MNNPDKSMEGKLHHFLYLECVLLQTPPQDKARYKDLISPRDSKVQVCIALLQTGWEGRGPPTPPSRENRRNQGERLCFWAAIFDEKNLPAGFFALQRNTHPTRNKSLQGALPFPATVCLPIPTSAIYNLTPTAVLTPTTISKE